MRPATLVLGQCDHADFASVRRWLEVHSRVLDAASAQSCESLSCELIAIFQSRPGEVEQSIVEEAWQRWPMARLMVVLGSWCEGEVRSGRPLAGVERVYWHEAIDRLTTWLTSERDALRYRTLTPAERIEQSLPPRCTDAARRTAIVVTRHSSAFEPLADACRCMGFQARWIRDAALLDESELPATVAPEVDLFVWDLNDCAAAAEHVAAAPRRWPQAKHVVLGNFPRRDEAATIEQLGAVVLAKPFLLADLAAALERV